jgi:hypothetical protein
MASINPDHHIEEFWLNFKNSMNNFYTATKSISRPIALWSDNLNNLQKNKQYDIIEKCIRDYISLYAIDILRCHANYYFNILYTNIKRWNVISQKYHFTLDDNSYHNVVFMLIDIYHSVTIKGSYIDDNIINIFSMVELYIINNDFTILITYAIEHNKPSIIDKLNKFDDINHIIETTYNIIVPSKSCGKKIISLIKNEK